MGKVHKVGEGDSVASLAEASGHLPDVIWSHPRNKALQVLRGNMNILAAGDEVYIPDLQVKSVLADTDKVHRFQRRGVPAIIRLQLLRNGKPRKHLRYRMEVSGAVIEGTTDERGVIESFVPPATREIRLYVGDSRKARVLKVGRLDPVDTVVGMQQRLRNLGHGCSASGAVDNATRAALRVLQRRVGLSETGEPDPETLAALLQAHDEIGGEH